MSTPNFSVVTSSDWLVLRFEGRLDSAGCAGLHQRVVDQIGAVQPQQSLRFDLAASDFVASAFLRLCVIAARDLGSERFELVNLGPLVREVFGMAGLDRHLRIVESSAP